MIGLNDEGVLAQAKAVKFAAYGLSDGESSTISRPRMRSTTSRAPSLEKYRLPIGGLHQVIEATFSSLSKSPEVSDRARLRFDGRAPPQRRRLLRHLCELETFGSAEPSPGERSACAATLCDIAHSMAVTNRAAPPVHGGYAGGSSAKRRNSVRIACHIGQTGIA